MRSLSFFRSSALALLFGALASAKVQAQRDVIITQASEEIRCRILDETPTRFIYAYIGPKGEILRNEIFKNLVKDFNYNTYDSDLVSTSFDEKKSKRGKKTAVNTPIERNPGMAKSENSTAPKKGKETKDNVELEDIKADEALVVEPNAGNLSKKEIRAAKKANKSKADTSDAQEVIAKETESGLPSVDAVEGSEPMASIDDREVLINPVVKESLPNSSETDKVNIPPVIQKDRELENPVGIVVSDLPQKTEEETRQEVLALEEQAKAIGIPVSPEPENEIAEKKPSNEFKNYLKWRVGAKAGIGNILDRDFVATNAFGLYQEQLLKGWNFGGDIAFFPMEGFGFGAVYTDFTSSNSGTDLNFINQMTGVEETGSISNKISRKFIGPAFFFRKSIDYKTFVVLGVSPGMYIYSDKGQYNEEQFNFKGREFGAAATLGLDFLLGNDIIGRDIILSLEAGYNKGQINGLDYGDGAGEILLDNPILLDRVDFSIALRFMRFPKYLKK